MATKKKTEVVETEAEVTAVEPVEEKPKKTSTRKKKVEEPVVEEVKAEEPVVEEPKVEEVPEVKEEPKVEEVKPVEEPKVEKKEEPKVEKAGFAAGDTALTTNETNVLKGPNRTFIKIDFLPSKTEVVVFEVSGNYARIGANRWVNINYLEKA